MKFGPTGDFPEGRLGPDDEGGLRIGITHDTKGNVIINFGKHISWIGFGPEQAIQLAKTIMKHAGAKKIEVTL